MRGKICVGVVLALGCVAGAVELAAHNTQYYTLHTNVDDDTVREAKLRITLMAEEYAGRLKGLAGTVRRKLPFYLFANQTDYVRLGGVPGTAGLFTGNALAAWVDERRPRAVWETVQHEGFHQFVVAAVGRDMPIWANEGLAEYFGYGQFSGDRFYVGLAPEKLVSYLQEGIRKNRFKHVGEMLHLAHADWNRQGNWDNYVLAWSIVHFLAHGERGRFQQPFINYLRDVSRGMETERSWKKHFGDDIPGFQKAWQRWWLDQPTNLTAELYAEVTLSTLTSFLARAKLERQEFENVEAFLAAAEEGTLKMGDEDWLPLWLAKQAANDVREHGELSLVGKGARQTLRLKLKNGDVLEGQWKTRNGRVTGVDVKPVKGGRS